ncbi:MAG: hypothetical protein P1V97_23835 [Planctomycetota bacterium]|nr:hypothetical protein [Planctomycetota bacterium]
MKSVIPAVAATIILALLIVAFMPTNKQAETLPEAKNSGQEQGSQKENEATTNPGPKGVVGPKTGPQSKLPSKPGTAKKLSTRSTCEMLLKKHSKNGFKEREFEGEFAYHLFKNQKETLEAVELFLEQDDYKIAHAMARSIAGTLVGNADARKLILDTLISPPSEMIGETALYTLLASHHHEEVQKTLIDIFTTPSKSNKMRTTAAFVIREGLSTMGDVHREKARHHAREIIRQSMETGPQLSNPAIRVECIAIVGGHLNPSKTDHKLMQSTLGKATDRGELEVTLAMLIRHQTPKDELVASLDKRIQQSADPKQRALFEELKRKTLSALKPTGKGKITAPKK